MKKVILIMLILTDLLYCNPGDLLWRYKLDGGGSNPFVADNIVYTGCSDSYLYAIYANNGTLKWRYKVEGYGGTSSPCVSNGIVYFGTLLYEEIFADFYALNAENGALIWKFRNYEDIAATPSVYNGIVYFNSDYIFALNAANGEEVWKYDCNAIVRRSPCVSNGIVYTSVGNKIMAFNAANGDSNWTYNNQEDNLTPLEYNNIVYTTASHEGNSFFVAALNSSDGLLKWEYETPHPLDTEFCIYNSLVYFTCGDLYALDAVTGDFKWMFKPDSVAVYPSSSEGTIYVGACDCNLYAIDANNGDLKWKYLTGGSIWSVPFVFNHVVYFGSGDSYLYAIETYGYKGFKENKSANKIPKKQFSVSPNPFTSYLSISSSSSASIYSITGQLIMKLDKGKHSLDTSSWREGIYIIKSASEAKRIIKLK